MGNTPGSWKYKPTAVYRAVVTDDEEESIIAFVCVRENDLRDAKIMAAAPSMLNILIDIRDSILIDFPDDDHRKVEINKILEKVN